MWMAWLLHLVGNIAFPLAVCSAESRPALITIEFRDRRRRGLCGAIGEDRLVSDIALVILRQGREINSV